MQAQFNFRIRHCLAALFILVAAASLFAQSPDPVWQPYTERQSEKEFRWETRLYDPSNPNGAQTRRSTPFESREILDANGNWIPHITISADAFLPGFTTGQNTLFRIYSPHTPCPCYEGIIGADSYVYGPGAGSGPLRWVIPVEDGDAAGITLPFRSYAGLAGQGFTEIAGVDVGFLIVDRLDSPSIAYDGNGLPQLGNRVAFIVVEYLEDPLETERHSVKLLDDNFYYQVAMFWGEHDRLFEISPRPDYVAPLTTTVPMGDVRISISIDGHTTDTLILQPRNFHSALWSAVLLPSKGPIAGIPPSLDLVRNLDRPFSKPILQRAISDDILARCELFLFLDDAEDMNNDGISDAADVVYAALHDYPMEAAGSHR